MRRFLLPLLIIVLVGGGAALALGRGRLPGAAVAPEPTLQAQAATPAVVAEAKVLPAADVTLSFERAGTVASLLVAEGDHVERGQPLARLDTRALELQLEQARVGILRAKAHYEQIAAGVSPEAIAAADAAIAQATASQAQVAAGVSPQDLAAGQAQLAEARAALAALLDGPKSTEVTQAQAALDQATTNLAAQSDALSAGKTNAQLQLEQAANALRNAQDSYSRLYWDNRELEDASGKELPQVAIDSEAAALRAVANAEAAMGQANVALEQARQAEADGIAAAEARVRDAQARSEQLVAPADADRVAAARAGIAAAEANLARLRGPAHDTQLGVAAAGVSQAEAAREQVAAPPREVDLSVARVEIEAAEVAQAQAEYDLDRATLSAPFSGVVARIDIDLGALAGPGSPALVLADLTSWRIETDDLSELDVVRLREGEAVAVGFDAIPDLSLPGRVQQIKPIGTNRQGDIVYTVVVRLEQTDPRLRWNMTAVVTAVE